MSEFFAGTLTGILIGFIVEFTAFLVFTHFHDPIKRTKDKLTLVVKRREPMSRIHIPTEDERAMERLKGLNSDRGGIPDSELR